eukprot:TRINITY_DN3592_c0_g1_i2.p1 TRINITY_DN3592_c0_g1~~TRINITY_DN3592_c0_g1_i2.p1  ORF type:complete len:105 (+),score=15.54 TRINITY_DN3592_c0_g1_i2:22-336(+)
MINPLENICSQPTSKVSTIEQKSKFIEHGSVAHQLVKQITVYMNQAESEDVQKIYSPSLLCYTSMTFWAAMVRVLKTLTTTIDSLGSTKRELVWGQVFALGMSK